MFFFSFVSHAGFWKTKVAWNTDYIFRFGQAGNTRIIRKMTLVGGTFCFPCASMKVKHLHLSAPKPKTTALAGIMAGLTNYFEGTEDLNGGNDGKEENKHHIYEVFEPWTKCSMQIFLGFCMPYHHTMDFFQHSQFELNKQTWPDNSMQISGEKKDDPFKGFKEVPRALGP